MNRFRSGLWKHPDFMKLWIGQTISEFGTRITRDGLPLAAMLTLAATLPQMGLLSAIGALPVLLISLFAGVWVDRIRRRPIMIGADVLRMAILLSIPAAALLGVLRIEQLYVVAALTGILAVTFEVAYHAYVPSLVARGQIVEANSKIGASEALAEIGGTTLAGVLITLISAPFAIFFDALSFLVSAASVTAIRSPEPPPALRATRQSIRREMIEGLHVIRTTPALRVLALTLGVRSFFGNFFAPLYGYFAIRELGLTPAMLGVVIAGGGIGGLIGALLAERITQRLGVARTLVGVALFGGVLGFLTPLAGGSALLAAAMLFTAQVICDGAMTIYAINELSLRQLITPGRLLGRTNATISFLSQGLAPFGALVGGLLGGLIGARAALLIAVIGGLLASLALLSSPALKLKLDFREMEGSYRPDNIRP